MTGIVWLTGPSGVGKSTAAWQLYQLWRDAMPVAVVDADQLGLVLPASPDDPGSHIVKARNLAAYWHSARLAGAQRLIVSGILDDLDTLGIYVDRLGERPAIIGLQAADAELRERVLGRGWNTHLAEAAIASSSSHKALPFLDLALDTSHLSPMQVAEEIQSQLLGAFSRPSLGLASAQVIGTLPRRVVWIAGPRAIGKSTVGFSLFIKLYQAGLSVAYFDSAQIAFLSPPSDGHATAMAVAMAENFAQTGVDTLIISGSFSQSTVNHMMQQAPGIDLEVIVLSASAEARWQRLADRAAGKGPPLMGDELVGAPASHFRLLLAEEGRPADARFDTTGLGVVETVDRLKARIVR